MRKYIRKFKNQTKLYGDSHAIEENTHTNHKKIRDKIRLVYSLHCKKILYKYYTKIFGLTPNCIEFSKSYFKTPVEKMELFPLGYDPYLCDIKQKENYRSEFRLQNGIPEDTVVILHGGKIIPRRNTIIAINAFLKVNKKNSIMIIFGEISLDLKDEIETLIKNHNDKILYLGHLNQKEYVKVMMASDLGFFPGAQSALWQEAIGCGLPIIVGYAKGIDYLNRGGNMISVKRNDLNDAVCILDNILSSDNLQKMKEVAESSARDFFSYDRISKLMIED